VATEAGLFATIQWAGGLDGQIEMIDQTLLPGETRTLHINDVETLWEAIKNLRVRGAPAIGVAAAMGVVLGVRDATSTQAFYAQLDKTCEYLASSRPTAVNLFWALNRMKQRAEALHDEELSVLKESLLTEAKTVWAEDTATCRAIGQSGAHLIKANASVLTHCNAGALATAKYGTALAPIYVAHEEGVRFQVYADETRPLLQGARLTAWELVQNGVEVTVICDNMAGALMQEGKVDLVITGADRIAANGDVANKIGTYGLAVLAHAHDVPFYVAAPFSTFDLSLSDGRQIPIEQRSPEEIRCGFGQMTAPEGAHCFNPAFDVTPAKYIQGIITEKGIIQPVCNEEIARLAAF
jgi:methylthioribose-1-phosphate isomerase